MKVTLTTVGGLAAGIRRPPTVIDSAALPPDQAAELKALAKRAAADPAPATAGPGRARDAQHYTITVESGDGPSASLSRSDTTLTPGFAALLAWIQGHGK